jgi:hypothetical protein
VSSPLGTLAKLASAVSLLWLASFTNDTAAPTPPRTLARSSPARPCPLLYDARPAFFFSSPLPSFAFSTSPST